jgi:hypothetical protein
MKRLGRTFFIFGVGSILLNFLNMEFVILSWIDIWGPTPGWIIRGSLAVVGAILWLVGANQEKTADTAQ